MLAFLAFFKSWELKIALAVMFLLGIFGYGFYLGHSHEATVFAKYRAAETKVVAADTKKQGVVTANVVTRYVSEQVVIHDKGQTITKEVPVYVTVKDDAACTINDGFVSLWNDANSGTVPGAPGPTDEAPSAVKLSDVATEHTVEATAYNSLANQLTELQAWVKAQQQAVSGVSLHSLLQAPASIEVPRN